MTAPTVDKGRVKELRAALETKTAELQRISDTFDVDDHGNVTVSTEKGQAFQTLVSEAKDIRGLLEAEMGLSDLRTWMNSADQAPVSAQDAVYRQHGAMQRKSLGEMFLESDSYQSEKNSSRPNMQFEVDYAITEQKDIYGGGQTPTGGNMVVPSFGTTENIGIRETRLRRQHVRDLFPKRTTTATKLVSVRETGFVNNAAQVTQRLADNSDFSTKPHSDMTFAPVSYEVARVAHYIKAHRDMLADEPRLKDFINRRMLDGIRFVEDRELLFGAGGTEKILGIMNTPGVQLYTGLSADKLTKQVRKAVTRSMLAEYDPTGIVVHPLDWETLELEETDDGHYRIAVNIAVGGQKRLWSMDIVATTAMTQGRYLLGNTDMGATIYDREQANIAISTENQDDFIRNLVTVRAESRLALVVDRPESFVAGTFTDYVAS